MIMSELPVCCGTLSWHLKMKCCTSGDSSAIHGKLIWREWGTMKSNFFSIPISRWKCFLSDHLNGWRSAQLLEKLFGLLQVKDITPLGLSQQYEAQEFLPDKVFYVPGCWRCRFFFRVDWLSGEIRICPASLLHHVRQVHAPLIFTPTGPSTE